MLSTEQIARTGEGNIAGALGRVTGLSVVGSGFVYVRGLGDRYSLALLNGSPLPSPEPLRRVVPLDLFPTGVIASSLVQKSYSVNYPGEFGGGVINLTTKATPDEGFLTVTLGGSWDSETTNQLGYTYYGSKTDWTGFDNGQRDIPPALPSFFASGERISSGNVDTQAIASELVNGRNAIVQRYDHMPANFSGSFSGGNSWDIGDGALGLIVGGGYSNRCLTRDAIQQTSLSADISTHRLRFPPRDHRPAHRRQRPASASASSSATTRSAGPTCSSATRSSSARLAQRHRGPGHRRRSCSRTPRGTSAS